MRTTRVEAVDGFGIGDTFAVVEGEVVAAGNGESSGVGVGGALKDGAAEPSGEGDGDGDAAAGSIGDGDSCASEESTAATNHRTNSAKIRNLQSAIRIF